ncbi:hypothetical protein HanPSC8_Chr03g0124271 [Helianthus annuus]|nr:hypothetical protein HanPSC8_Chr03g0124271 [Helianthus annuus]
MSSTIFPSLTTFFSGGGHHSSPHPTISPNQQFHPQNQTITALIFPRKMPSRVNYMAAVGTIWPSRVIRKYNVTAPGSLTNSAQKIKLLMNIKKYGPLKVKELKNRSHTLDAWNDCKYHILIHLTYLVKLLPL